MIKYTLTCDKNHQFESWFASSDAYTTLRRSGMITCVTCGSASVDKALMSPRVTTSPKKDLAAPTPQDTSLSEMRKTVEDNADYVGPSFAKEARAMHDGKTQNRAIYGEANLKDAKALIEDGIPVLPLPFIPKRKTN